MTGPHPECGRTEPHGSHGFINRHYGSREQFCEGVPEFVPVTENQAIAELRATLPPENGQPTSPLHELAKSNVLTQASDLIFGDRAEAYGPPSQSFGSIAAMWTAYLNAKAHEPGQAITPMDVAHMMILMKVSRATTGGAYREDNYMDIAGYAGCAERIHKDV